MISHIKIKNYRSCKNVEFDLTEVLPIVGMNNVGKSNILKAIEWFISPTSLKIGDFFDVAKSVAVEGTFTDVLSQLPTGIDRNKTSILPFIIDDRLRIRRVQATVGQSVKDITCEVLDSDGTWKPTPTGLPAALKALIMPNVIKIDAMEDCAEDVTKNKSASSLGQLMKFLQDDIADAVKGDKKLRWAFEIYNQKFNESSQNKLNVFDEIDTELNKHVSHFWQNPQLKMSTPLLTLDDIVKNATLKIGENLSNFTSLGHGAQRSIQMGFLKYLAEKKKRGSNIKNLLLIDEPELYLHPHAIELVRDALEDLSDKGFQVIFTTHSPAMITPEKVVETLRVKMLDKETLTSQTLSEAVKTIVGNSITQTEILFSFYGNSQVLFSEKLLLVEGHSEEALIPHLFRLETGKSLQQLNIGLINMTSCNNLKKMGDILEACNIEYCALVDLDCIKSVNDPLIDTDIATCKVEIAKVNNVSLNGDWPKDGFITASQAFSELAKRTEAKAPIKNICTFMKSKNIWLWNCGDFEDLIGKKLSGGKKAKAEQANIITEIKSQGISSAIENYDELKRSFMWIAPLEIRGFPLTSTTTASSISISTLN